MLQTGRFDLERPDAVAGGDDHVVGPAFVPEVPLVVEGSRVLSVEPIAAEDLLAGLRVVPVAERIVGVGARPQADLPALSRADRLLVLVQDPDVPTG